MWRRTTGVPKWAWGAAAVALIVMAGCGDSSGPKAGAPAPLAGPQWVLDTDALGVTGAAGVTATLRFQDSGRVTGSDGCNTLSGTYTTDGSAIRFGPIAGTRKYCPPPAGTVASRVLAGLDRTRSSRVTSSRLELLDAGGTVLLTYRATTPSVTGRWKAVSVLYAGAIHSVLAGTTLTADFGAAGHLTGSGGCNSYAGDFTVDRDALRIASLLSTQMACPEPAGINEQEQGYFAALASVRRFDQAGDSLTLFDAQGRMAVTLHRAGATP